MNVAGQKVSIGMPVFNDKLFLKKAVDSILAQTFRDFELIIADDCSSDGSADICREYADRDDRIRYIRHQHNMGISRNMEFLLAEARYDYFMWAANDDIWEPEFIAELMQGFVEKPAAVAAFCPYVYIDEQETVISDQMRSFDYSGGSACERIKKLVKINDDGFGYGLFKKEFILGVKFPVWWGVNAKCAYNNIYPTLCYYLTKGDFVLRGNRPLWLNRMKSNVNVNHKIPYPNNFLRGYFAFSLRKFNLVAFSLASIVRAEKNLKTFFCVFPRMFYSWFVIPVTFAFKGWFKRFKNKEISFW